MSGFVRPDFVEEFAFRTRANYYSLRIAQAREAGDTANEDKYTAELDKLRTEMNDQKYDSSKNYFEVTQLINSLIGLLIFPQQVYYDVLGRLSLEKDLPTLSRIIQGNENGSFICTYKEKLDKLDLTSEEKEILHSKDYKKKDKLAEKVFGKLCQESETPAVILRHMRNAAAHEKLQIKPISQNERISSVVFEDSAFGFIKPKKGDYYPDYGASAENRNTASSRYGYFRLEIGVDVLEDVLVEISKAIVFAAAHGEKYLYLNESDPV